jgi:uncharacterized protein YbgA (DUF1722 family)/uncharacterized protein YbbK (DUF523 family)
MEEIRVGISSCLLGERVRFDGGHKEDRFLTKTLAPHIRFVSVCPELEIGLGTPRESLRLIGDPAFPRMVAPKSGTDLTEKMADYARHKLEELRALDLSGYVLKRGSPTCGMERVRVYDENGVPNRAGRGTFARALLEGMPLLPVEEEGRLTDPIIRESFIERVFAHHRVMHLCRGEWTIGDLVAFHTREKYLLLAHDPKRYQELGRLVAASKSRERGELREEYTREYMQAFAVAATRAKHVNVLQHMAGFLRDVLGAAARREIAATLDDYRQALLPLVVPVTLLRHYVRVHDIEYLAGQTYLEPHPRELMLRNHS